MLRTVGLKHTRWVTFGMAVSIVAACSFFDLPAQSEAQQREEAQDYYRKWLEEDVVYIITPEEKDVFLKLQTTDEKDAFIEQFWLRRDPNPATSENEFKAEHYRRIAYVNERYFSGIPGWKSDRGMIYIRFGPPGSVEKQPSGGPYKRPNSEGGGETTVFPFEKWWYAHIEGVGDDIEIEFVDRTQSGEYRISLNPNDKDAFLYIAGHGNTQREFDGETTRFDRISAPLGIQRNNPFLRSGDLPFQRLREWALIQHSPEINEARLEELVDTKIRYEELPMSFSWTWFRMGQQVLVPITLGFDEADLQFGEDGMASEAKVLVIGRVRSLQGRIVSTFEDEIVKSRSTGAAESVMALYQKALILEPGRYRLDLVAEDSTSTKLATLQQGLTIPELEGDQLSASPILLVERADPIDSSAPPEMFGLGTHKIIPRLSQKLPEVPYLVFYMQFYNYALDEAAQAPQLDLTYRVLEGDRVVTEKSDPGASRAVFTSAQRVAVLEYLPLRKATGAALKLEVRAIDRVTGQELTVEQPVWIERNSPD